VKGQSKTSHLHFRDVVQETNFSWFYWIVGRFLFNLSQLWQAWLIENQPFDTLKL